MGAFCFCLKHCELLQSVYLGFISSFTIASSSYVMPSPPETQKIHVSLYSGFHLLFLLLVLFSCILEKLLRSVPHVTDSDLHAANHVPIVLLCSYFT